MSALDTFKNIIGGGFGGGNSYVASLNPFLQIDVDALAREMQLKEKGAERGEAGLPPTESNALDDVELEIIDRIDTEASQTYRECVNELRVIDGSLSSLDLLGSFSRARTAASSALGDFEAEARVWDNRLSNLRRQVKTAHAHLETFKIENNLQRNAQRPLRGMAYWGTVIGAIMIESLINSVFLRVNDDLGYVGGFVMAFAIAFVNVTVATMFGKFVMPLRKSVKSGARIQGQVGLVAYLLLALVLNLVGAHYRTLKGQGVDDPGAAAITSFMAHPFGVHDYISWLLVAFGIGCSLAALWAGFRSDDEYPGYGRLYREYQDVLEDYNDGVEDFYETLGDIKDTTNDTMLAAERALSKNRREYESALQYRGSLIALYSQQHPSLETAANRLLGIYRNANRGARTTVAPTRFDDAFKPRELADPGMTPPPNISGQLDVELADTQRALSAAIEAINNAYTAHVNRFKTIDELLD